MTNLHFKSKLLHFFKEIMNYKSCDKIRIQVVHYVFCSAKLKEKHKIINIYILSPEHQHKLRWLDGAFQGLYLPILSNNYVAIKKDLEKLPPQLYWINLKIWTWLQWPQCCHGNEMTPLPILLAAVFVDTVTFLPTSLTGVFSSNSRPDVRDAFKRNIWQRYRVIIGLSCHG